MTFFDQLQLPPGVLVGEDAESGRPSKDGLTVGETLQGLWFELSIATEFLLFLFSVIIFLCVEGSAPNWAVIILTTVFVGWQILVRNFRNVSTQGLFLTILGWTIFVIFIITDEPELKFYAPIFSGLVCVWLLGFHPLLRLFLQVPLCSPAVQTGVFLFLSSLGSFLFWIRESAGVQWLLSVLCLSLGCITAALAAETSLVFYRTSLLTQPVKLKSPWKDVFLSIKTVTCLPVSIGIGISSLLRLLQAEDSDEMLTEKLLQDALGERGVLVWEFLVGWKVVRLGKPRLDEDLVVSMRKRAQPVQEKQPLRSPLLRGK
jgi:hypothetical protein